MSHDWRQIQICICSRCRSVLAWTFVLYLQVQRCICKCRGCICKCRGCICTYTAVSASTEAHLQVQRLYLQVQRLYLQVQICICKCHMPANKYRSVFAADADLCLYELLCCVCKCRGCICKCRGCICKYRGCICKYSSCYCTHGRCTTLLSRVHVLKIIWSTAPAHADNNNAFLFFQHSSSTQDVLL